MEKSFISRSVERMKAGKMQLALLAAAVVIAGWLGFGGDGGHASAETSGTAAPAAAAHTITVQATGSVLVEPDVAYLNLAVETKGDTAQAAQQANAAKFAAVEKTLLDKFGLDAKDVKTTGFNVQAEYDYTEKNGRVLKGYTAVHQIQVTFRKLDQIGQLLDALSAAGANRMDGVTFGTEKQDQYELDALKKAMANAEAKANVLADAAKQQIKGVVSIVQGNPTQSPILMPTTVAAKELASTADSASTSIQSGQIEISVDVTVQYEMQ
jgi:hypothetical protein